MLLLCGGRFLVSIPNHDVNLLVITYFVMMTALILELRVEDNWDASESRTQSPE